MGLCKWDCASGTAQVGTVQAGLRKREMEDGCFQKVGAWTTASSLQLTPHGRCAGTGGGTQGTPKVCVGSKGSRPLQAVDAPAHGRPLTHRAKGLIVYLCCADAAEFAELLHSLARLGEHFNRRPARLAGPACPHA